MDQILIESALQADIQHPINITAVSSLQAIDNRGYGESSTVERKAALSIDLQYLNVKTIYVCRRRRWKAAREKTCAESSARGCACRSRSNPGSTRDYEESRAQKCNKKSHLLV
jgi:hypothetical protein